ncbi:MAG: hypothetical protein A2Z91_02250 [Deltaproteobacteria bacterium GWA2_38_16]|nr:MAG: hypothetical protein A2Z91_02250 [Deltaproteobacteria bacterium GWA2_38_16]OGQ02018.1 MAG: hypothetical protein A3D19_08545 [Deltaproteobacteria bacterium RIFCSPHIGHO2_02_FULL_38_15]OGQ30884.1 MAG: hypothetical protein A3A72_02040 [Deltaproteobacteria bacterium RIFCSPLOWO2_01_FULL_38_9]OGQ61068.1 MAG: hypothetical protein A3G92_02015 [Deltaproteobacteria bacterium RIFCSPLOWO2_12_FULL_38_8]HBQ21551.1 hypothetical protein [Deltaproteobacteria bacterium]
MKKLTILLLGLLCLFSNPTQASKKQDHPLFYSILIGQRNAYEKHITNIQKFMTSVKKEDLGGLNRQGVEDNAIYIAALLDESSAPLDAIMFCHDNNLERLDEADIQAIREARNNFFTSAIGILEAYAQNVANWQQRFEDTSKLQEALEKVVLGKAKLQEILSRAR